VDRLGSVRVAPLLPAAAGIPRYWIVERDKNNTVEMYRLAGTEFELERDPQAKAGGGTAPVSTSPDAPSRRNAPAFGNRCSATPHSCSDWQYRTTCSAGVVVCGGVTDLPLSRGDGAPFGAVRVAVPDEAGQFLQRGGCFGEERPEDGEVVCLDRVHRGLRRHAVGPGAFGE
jgi:hypothetical protein